MAANYRHPVEHLKAYYNQDQDRLAFFKHTLLEKKALRIIIEGSEVKEVDPSEKTEK